jgi:hypothetical protein
MNFTLGENNPSSAFGTFSHRGEKALEARFNRERQIRPLE